VLSSMNRDRLIGAGLMGAIWTILCVPIISGFNPIAAFLQELGPVGAATIPVLFLVWTGAYFGIFTLWERRRR
jgi:hypothetical protein